jgi:2-dehydropantoate 2-reductase
VQIVVLGAGAIGSVVGARLYQAGEAVRLIGRAAHVEAIQANGLLLRDNHGSHRIPVPATASLAGTADLILLTVKSQDVRAACRMLAELPSNATVVTMQNGVRSDQEAAAILGRDRIVGCVLNVSATYLEPGVVEQNTAALLQLGAPFVESAGRVPPVVQVFQRAARTQLVPDIARARWTKLMANLNNAIMTITGLPIGTALRHHGLARLAIATIREGVKTARAGGQRLDDSRRARAFRLMAALPFAISVRLFGPRLAGGFPPHSQFGPSTLQSLKRGASSELDYLNGEIVQLGERIGQSTPVNSSLLKAGRRVFESRRTLTPDELIRTVEF